MGLGNPRVSPPPPPQPQAFHVLWPPFCLVSTAIFIPCSFQSTALVCVCGGRAAGHGTARGVGGAQGAHWAVGMAGEPWCPSKGRLPPAPCRPPCPLLGGLAEMHSAKPTRVTRPRSVFELVCETRCQPLLHPQGLEGHGPV